MARGELASDYPLLSGGDVNLYSLFVERAMKLVKPEGMVGLLTPSGIASDKTAAPFFKGISTGGHLKALYDFENRRTRFNAPPFFPDVDSRFKFCATIASPVRTFDAARCAFFLQDVSELTIPNGVSRSQRRILPASIRTREPRQFQDASRRALWLRQSMVACRCW